MNPTKRSVLHSGQALEARTALAMRMTRRRTQPVGGDDSVIIVSMTSHPARIRNAWMALESLLRQDLRPLRIVLTLSEEEFPSRRLPRVYRRLMKRGVELLWTPRNTRSFKKLLPVAAANPASTVITVDDDKLFAPDRIAAVVTASAAHPGTIVGAQGWEMRTVSGRLEWSKGWERADLTTPSDAIFLTSGTATLYPPGSLSDLLHDYELANRLVPTNDDMWFWAMARLAGAKQICLGLDRLTRIVRQDATPSLAAINEQCSESQFAALREFLPLDGDLIPALREARAR